MKIADKIKLFRKPLKVYTASGASLGPIGIATLDLNIEKPNFTYELIVCTKLKQHLILGIDFAQRCKIGIQWDIPMEKYSLDTK